MGTATFPSLVALPPMKTKKHNTTTTTGGSVVTASTTTSKKVRNNPKKNLWNNNSPAGVLDHRLLAMGVPSDPEVSSSLSPLEQCSIQLLNGSSTGQHPATERRRMSEAERRHRWRRQCSSTGGLRWGTSTAVGVLVFIVVFIDLFCASASSSIHSSSSGSHRTLEHAAVEAALADLGLSEIYGKGKSRCQSRRHFCKTIPARKGGCALSNRYFNSVAQRNSLGEENGKNAECG